MVKEKIRSTRKRAIVVCSTPSCSLCEFLVREPFGMDIEVFPRVSGKIVDGILMRDPDLVAIHTNGDGYSDWEAVIKDLNAAIGVPIVVLVTSPEKVAKFSPHVDLTMMVPLTYIERIQFVGNLYCLAHGAPPGSAPPTPVAAPAPATTTGPKDLLRLIEWTLALSLLLSSLVGMVVLLARGDAEEAATAFGTIFSSTIAAFTSVGGLRLVRHWRRLRSGDPQR